MWLPVIGLCCILYRARNDQRAASFESAPSVTLLKTLNYDSRRTQSGLFIQPQLEIQSPDSDVNHNGPTSVGGASDSSLLYKLSAVMVHIGGVASGHFLTYRRSPNTVKGRCRRDKWLCCSDRSVTPVSKMDVFSAEAYMLIYERIWKQPLCWCIRGHESQTELLRVLANVPHKIPRMLPCPL